MRQARHPLCHTVDNVCGFDQLIRTARPPACPPPLPVLSAVRRAATKAAAVITNWYTSCQTPLLPTAHRPLLSPSSCFAENLDPVLTSAAPLMTPGLPRFGPPASESRPQDGLYRPDTWREVSKPNGHGLAPFPVANCSVGKTVHQCGSMPDIRYHKLNACGNQNKMTGAQHGTGLTRHGQIQCWTRPCVFRSRRHACPSLSASACLCWG